MDQQAIRANITVAEKHPPAQGKKQWKIMDTNSVKYNLSENVTPYVNVGGQYEVSYTENTFQGQRGAFQYKTIIYAKPLTAAPAQSGVPMPPAPPPPPPTQPQQQTFQPIGQAAQPTLDQYQAGQRFKDEQIAVQAILKAITGIPAGSPQAILDQLKQNAWAWREFLKWQKSGSAAPSNQPQGQQRDEEMNDEIPF